jgi:hypothetical protein
MKRLCGVLVATTFVFIGCNRAETPATEEQPPAAAAAPQPRAYGNLAQVMQAIPFPASNLVFDVQSADPGVQKEGSDPGAGSTTGLYSGVYGGWTAVENAGVALQETANLIMIPGRTCQNGKPVPIDQEDYRQWAADLAAVGAEVQKMAQGKTWNEDAVLELGGKLSDACAACHDKYRETPNQPADRCTP